MSKSSYMGRVITAMFLVDAAFALEIFLLNIFGKNDIAKTIGEFALVIILAVWCLLGIKYSIHLAKEHKEMELTKNSAPAMISSLLIMTALSTVIKIDIQSVTQYVESYIVPIASDLFTVVTLIICLAIVFSMHQKYCTESNSL